jgi:hypothetical protein
MSADSSYAFAPGVHAHARTDRVWASIVRRLPIVVFLLVYGFTCYIGTLALLLSDRFRTVFLVFSGASVPDLSTRDAVITLVLLHAGPLLLWAGYELAIRWRAAIDHQDAFHGSEPSHVWRGRVCFAVSVAIAAWSLTRAGGWARITAWNDYNSYIYARWNLFDRLGFFEFVNLYTVLPITAAYGLLVEKRRGVGFLFAALALALQYPLALRKVLISTAALLGCALYVWRFGGAHPRRHASGRRQLAMWFGGPAALYILYTALTLQTVFSPNTRPFQTIREQVAPPVATVRTLDPSKRRVSFAIDAAAINRIESSRAKALTLYTLFSPLTRTSIAAIAYPAVFPGILPYFHLDLGQDILGIGRMPDDNLVVYHVLWPEHHRGSITAPFQYVLYSQGGVVIAAAGSVLLGLLLGGLWRMLVLSASQPGPVASVGAAVVLLLAVFLAIDSPRNSLIVSYGLAWAVPVLVVLAVPFRRTPATLPAGHLAHIQS